LAETHPEWSLVFLVNEFADSNIDELTLETTGTPTQSVVGGSLFCECKAGEFVRVMQETVLAQHAHKALDAIVIETSGIADPEAIGHLMSMHGLADHFEIQRIVCVVAAKRFLSLLKNLPAVQAQVRTSDLVIINKTDLAEAETVERVEAAIRGENPNAAILRSQHCAIPFDLTQVVRELPQRPLFTCDANPFSTETVLWPPQRSIAEAKAWLEALPETILRIKGTFQTPEGTWQVERTVDTLEVKPIRKRNTNQLILIAHDDHEADLQAALASISP
jgi:G3E family GTPase